MIIKSFDIDKIKSLKNNVFLIYGENEGLKTQIINDAIVKVSREKIERFDEQEIIVNFENFISDLMNKSFFQEKRFIIISRISEKIIKLVNEILDKNIDDILLIINAGNLEKKSKLRNFFEKENNLVCIPVYDDEQKTLTFIANDFFKNNKILISRESINLIVERCAGDRQNLNLELKKISLFMKGKDKITTNEIIKLTNLAENYSISELTDNCLSKNSKKTIRILNENNFSAEDSIIIIRTLLSKSKRLLKLKKEFKKSDNIEKTISSYKPPIFWKDKEIVKNQVKNWTLKDAEKLVYKINDVELMVKKNSNNSINILSDFLLHTSH